MARFTVFYSPEAEAQLIALYRYIAHQASPRLAQGFTGKIVDYCQSLEDFPERGAARSDLRPGLRTLTFRRVLIAYAVEDDIVTIIGVFYGGQDYETILTDG
jgi:toxin ParE1/3/4